jgi:hypothetical protein
LLFGGATADNLIPATRRRYSGPLLVGEDLMQFDIGENIQAQRFHLSEASPIRR